MKTSYEINFDIFNFLRFIALFCVLGTHARIVIYQNLLSFRINDSFEWWMYTPAWLAMSMFFILSGYLLGKGFYNERYRTDFYGMLNFWISRFIRIVPIYWFTILITFLFIAPEKFVVDQGKTLIPMLTFIYNGSNGIAGLGHFWFVSTIMQLYLIAPLVYKFVFVKFAKHNLLVFWGVFFLWLFFRIEARHLHLDWYLWVYTPSWMNFDLFFTGMLLNSLIKNSSDNKLKKWLRPASLLALFILIIFCMFLYKNGHNTFQRYYAPSICIVVFAFIFYSFDIKDRKIASLNLENIAKNPLRVFEIFGILSYGAYVSHPYLFSIMPRLIANPKIFSEPISNDKALLLILPISLFIIFSWAWLLNICIEKTANKYRERFVLANKKIF